MSESSYRVLKFGGTSVGTPERLLRVADIIASERETGPVAVVVSAQGHTTDRLIEAAEAAAAGRCDEGERIVDALADETTSRMLVALGHAGCGDAGLGVTPTVREHFAALRKLLYAMGLLRERTAQTLDLVLSFGEVLSAQLLAELLAARGVPATFVDARTWTVTDDQFGAALVDVPASEARLAELRDGWNGRVPVVTGFLGATPDGRTTTLGRNGSDYTASLLARALRAAEVVVWTDVPGVMTADPAIVGDAYPLARMSYMEALELANFGARMFHPRTMIPLIESGTPMRIRSTIRPQEQGTLIDREGDRDETRPTSVTSLENQALLSVEWRSLTRPAHVGERVLRALAAAGVTVWMENQAAHGQSIALVVPAGQVGQATASIEAALETELRRGEVERVAVRQPVTLLTLVAEAMGRTSGVQGRFFHALGAVGVNVFASAQGASSRSVCCAIDAADTPVAVRTVHAAFNLAHQQVSLFVLGKGTVGGELLAQIAGQAEELRAEHDVALRVVGIADSERVLFDEAGIDPGDWAERLAATGPEPDVSAGTVATLERLRRLPVPILVDCSAADGMESLYEAAFSRGIHVAAANKKPLTEPWEQREQLMSVARRHHRAYHYETTVGASLPVIDTLKNLVRTGDRVRLIEGSFSGTLGYLTNEVMDGVPLSQAVRTARDLGYTEPNPQDDLSGLDAARKALILARELGFSLEMEDIEVEPLVPESLLRPMALEAFYAALAEHDRELEAQIERARADGKTLRYLAQVDPGDGSGPCRLRVGPTFIDADHPATRLRGSEAFVAFTTERYSRYPLIVQGAGAGGAVTAAGVLADVLRIAQTLRGR